MYVWKTEVSAKNKKALWEKLDKLKDVGLLEYKKI